MERRTRKAGLLHGPDERRFKKAVSAIFGGAPAPSMPTPPQPDPGLLAAQKAQEDRLKKQEDEEAAKLKANRALIAARSGRGQGVTLNAATGERGVSDTLGG